MKKFLIFFVIIFALAGCTGIKTSETDTQNGKLKIVATLFPLYEFAKEVGGDKAQVHLLLPPGTEAHTFDPSPRDIVKISKADVLFYIGENMEPWVHDIFEGIENENLILVEASEYVRLLKAKDEGSEEETHEENNLHSHGEYDPHIWLDFENDQKLVDAISSVFIKKDPENKELYESNARSYKYKLQDLDKKYKKGLKNCDQNKFITGGHNAYSYLAHRYNISYISAYALSPDSEPTPNRIKEMVDLSKEHGIKYILVERLVSPRMAEAIAEEVGMNILVFDPGQNLAKEEFSKGVTFIDIMTENLKNLKQALECHE